MLTQTFLALNAGSSAIAASSASSCLGSGTRSSRIGHDANAWPWQEYETAPYQPPNLQIEHSGQPLAPGYLFIGPSNFNVSMPPATKQPAPYIMTDTNDLVWAGPDANTTNFRVQQLNGEPVLTYWSGYSTLGGNIGHGYGAVHILNDRYEKLYVVNPKLGLLIEPKGDYPGELDLHESYITERNTLLATGYNITRADLSSVGGPKNGWINDCQFYEIDIKTGKVLFKWSSIEHVPVHNTKLPLVPGQGANSSAAFDYFHINSVQSVGKNYLINARHTWSTYFVSSSGKIIWTINGATGGDFGSLPPGGRFEWQHEARAHNVTAKSIDITWFNNRNQPKANGTHQTNALGLHLPLPPSKSNPPTLTTRLLNNPPEYADSQGSYEILPNGHQLVGFGELPLIKEYGKSKTNNGNKNTLWTARFGRDDLVQSYRAYKTVWHGAPRTKPSIVVKQSSKQRKCKEGFVSWNGATDVDGWNIYEGRDRSHSTKVGFVNRKGFETGFGISANAKCVQVGAVTKGKEVQRSNISCR